MSRKRLLVSRAREADLTGMAGRRLAGAAPAGSVQICVWLGAGFAFGLRPAVGPVQRGCFCSAFGGRFRLGLNFFGKARLTGSAAAGLFLFHDLLFPFTLPEFCLQVIF